MKERLTNVLTNAAIFLLGESAYRVCDKELELGHLKMRVWKRLTIKITTTRMIITSRPSMACIAVAFAQLVEVGMVGSIALGEMREWEIVGG